MSFVLTECNIRPIRESDNEALAHIIRSSIEALGLPSAGTAHSDPTTLDLFRYFKKEGSFYWVAESPSAEVLGGCGIYPSPGLPAGYCELVRFFLAPGARGLGLGKLLIKISLEKASEMAYTHCYLESFPDMKTAITLYEKNGFDYLEAPLGNTGHFACNVWMVKSLAY